MALGSGFKGLELEGLYGDITFGCLPRAQHIYTYRMLQVVGCGLE